MDAFIERVRNEPVLVQGFVQAVLGLLLAFGLDLSNEQTGSIMVLTAALLAFVARGKVVPTRTLNE
jgi:ABC-type amino acid transport system permease subunit